VSNISKNSLQPKPGSAKVGVEAELIVNLALGIEYNSDNTVRKPLPISLDRQVSKVPPKQGQRWLPGLPLDL
jgi:hypothetical protein